MSAPGSGPVRSRRGPGHRHAVSCGVAWRRMIAARCHEPASGARTTYAGRSLACRHRQLDCIARCDGTACIVMPWRAARRVRDDQARAPAAHPRDRGPAAVVEPAGAGGAAGCARRPRHAGHGQPGHRGAGPGQGRARRPTCLCVARGPGRHPPAGDDERLRRILADYPVRIRRSGLTLLLISEAGTAGRHRPGHRRIHARTSRRARWRATNTVLVLFADEERLLRWRRPWSGSPGAVPRPAPTLNAESDDELTPAGLRGRGSSEPLKILVVDDEPAMVGALGALLGPGRPSHRRRLRRRGGPAPLPRGRAGPGAARPGDAGHGRRHRLPAHPRGQRHAHHRRLRRARPRRHRRAARPGCGRLRPQALPGRRAAGPRARRVAPDARHAARRKPRPRRPDRLRAGPAAARDPLAGHRRCPPRSPSSACCAAWSSASARSSPTTTCWRPAGRTCPTPTRCGSSRTWRDCARSSSTPGAPVPVAVRGVGLPPRRLSSARTATDPARRAWDARAPTPRRPTATVTAPQPNVHRASDHLPTAPSLTCGRPPP